MTVRAFGEEFDVIFAKNAPSGYRILQCRERRGGGEYTFLCFAGDGQVKKLLPCFLPLAESGEYEEYRGCFVEEGAFYLVFCAGHGEVLDTLLEDGSLPLARRYLLGRHLLEKLMLCRIPCQAAAWLLDVRAVLVDGNGISFDYGWEGEIEVDGGMALLDSRLSEFFQKLFREEISRGTGPEFTEFLESLGRGEWQDYLSVFEAYLELYGAVAKGAEEPPSLWERAGEKLKKASEKLQEFSGTIAAAAVCVAVIAALFAGMWVLEKREEEEQGVPFEAIGTLEIRGDET